MSIIQEAINKFGGADEVYKNKLKEHIKNAMGYSNYMSKMTREMGGTPDIGDLKGLSPQGVQARIGSKFGIQKQNLSNLDQITGSMDLAAGTLASEQAAREKASRAAGAQRYGINNGVMFNPESELEQKINDYMKNPYNPDGSTKSLQQFESEVNSYYNSPEKMQTSTAYLDDSGNPVPYAVQNPDNVKAAIQKRIPKDFIGNEGLYSAMAQGYSKKQATDPSTAGAVRDVMQTTVDPVTGDVLPKYTMQDIQNKYPDLTDAEAKGIMKPVLQKSMAEDINGVLADEQTKTVISETMRTGGYVEVMKLPEYQNLRIGLENTYPDFTSAEINSMLFKAIMSY